MKKPYLRRMLLVPLIYIAVLFLLVCFQFSGRESFNFRKKFVQFHGSYLPATDKNNKQEKEIADLSIDLPGVQLVFSAEESARIKTADSSLILVAKTFQLQETGFEFQALPSFNLSADINNDRVYFTARLKQKPVLQELALPFRLESGWEISYGNGIPIMSFKKAEERYFLSLPAGSIINQKDKLLILKPRQKQSISFIFEKAPAGVSNPFTYWMARGSSSVSEEEFNRQFKNYWDKAFLGWRRGRFSPAYANWTYKKETPRFSEALINALFSEAIERGQYQEIQGFASYAAQRNPGKPGFKSSFFLGNIIQNYEKYKVALREELSEITKEISEEDISILKREDIISLLRIRGGEELYKNFMALIQEIDIKEISIREALSLYQLYLESLKLNDPKLKSLLADFSAIIPEVLLPSLSQTPVGILVSDKGKGIDIYASLKAAALLRLTRGTNTPSYYSSLGKGLIMSVFSLADENGMLPEFYPSSDLKEERGVLAPEELYHLLKPDNYYPQIHILDEEKSLWIQSAAHIKEYRLLKNSLEIDFEYPENLSQIFITGPLSRLNSVYLYNKEWRFDYWFEKYPMGVFYDETEQVLYGKILHKEKTETVKLIF